MFITSIDIGKLGVIRFETTVVFLKGMAMMHSYNFAIRKQTVSNTWKALKMKVAS